MLSAQLDDDDDDDDDLYTIIWFQVFDLIPMIYIVLYGSKFQFLFNDNFFAHSYIKYTYQTPIIASNYMSSVELE